MKQITIYQKDCVPIVFGDQDASHVSEYTKELVKLLESNNISVLHTSTCSVIIRPSKITSIHVCDFDEGKREALSLDEKENNSKEEITEEFEGIITD
jgi:hypothetical protein